MSFKAIFLVLFLYVSVTFGYENGTHRYPVMAWCEWNHFYGNYDQDDVLTVMNAMKTNGMYDAGYNTIQLDVGIWTNRTPQGYWMDNYDRFPNGIQWLCDT
ncbi:MAG TPA: hypothetical protein VLL07_06475, partial [Pontiella sp.]|nr:hypothetical protein [Pontiella sp.]